MSELRKQKRSALTTSTRGKSPWTLADAYNNSVRPYIDIVDSLRTSGIDQDVSLPSVVVIGDQSTGKSSVLEAISGVQLPRGTGIVTRCALELRLIKIKGKDADTRWKGQLRYASPEGGEESVDLEDPGQVEAAVREAQDALAGEGKGVSEDGKIELVVSSPNVPDLTLIDLPGITRIAAHGQPDDIEDKVKRLIKKHIVKGETIILCVIPCTNDITTIEALRFAKEVDPDGDRTLGVLTRADQTGPGEEKSIIDIVQHRSDVQLKLGCTVVKCRSQKDIDANMSLEEALQKERDFFKNHEMFSTLDSSTTGIEQLSLKLTRQLVDHIRACLPNLLEDVETALRETNEGLSELGAPIPKDKLRYLIQILLHYGRTLASISQGDCQLHKEVNGYGHLFSDIRSCFSEFGQTIHKLCRDDNLEAIEQKIKERRGRELPGYCI
jgi:interferon-induced GTP-binding protein Mx1